jgi:hypothetical protein
VSQRPDDDAWLVRPATIRLLWRSLWIVLALTVAAHLVIKVKGYFGIDAWYGFGAAFGFLSCVLMVVVARGLGVLLKRDQDYYAGEQDDD